MSRLVRFHLARYGFRPCLRKELEYCVVTKRSLSQSFQSLKDDLQLAVQTRNSQSFSSRLQIAQKTLLVDEMLSRSERQEVLEIVEDWRKLGNVSEMNLAAVIKSLGDLKFSTLVNSEGSIIMHLINSYLDLRKHSSTYGIRLFLTGLYQLNVRISTLTPERKAVILKLLKESIHKRMAEREYADIIQAVAGIGVRWLDIKDTETKALVLSKLIELKEEFTASNKPVLVSSFGKMKLLRKDAPKAFAVLTNVGTRSVEIIQSSRDLTKIAELISGFAGLGLTKADLRPMHQSIYKLLELSWLKMNQEHRLMVMEGLSKMSFKWYELPTSLQAEFEETFINDLTKENEIHIPDLSNYLIHFKDMGYNWHEDVKTRNRVYQSIEEYFRDLHPEKEYEFCTISYVLSESGLRWLSLPKFLRDLLLNGFSVYLQHWNQSQLGTVLKGFGILGCSWIYFSTSVKVGVVARLKETINEMTINQIGKVLHGLWRLGYHLQENKDVTSLIVRRVTDLYQSDQDKNSEPAEVDLAVFYLGMGEFQWKNFPQNTRNALYNAVEHIPFLSGPDICRLFTGFGKMSCSYDELPTSVRNSLTRLVSQIKSPLNTTETFFILSGLNGMGTSWQLVEEEICQYLSRNLLYNIPNYNMGEIMRAMYEITVLSCDQVWDYSNNHENENDKNSKGKKLTKKQEMLVQIYQGLYQRFMNNYKKSDISSIISATQLVIFFELIQILPNNILQVIIQNKPIPKDFILNQEETISTIQNNLFLKAKEYLEMKSYGLNESFGIILEKSFLLSRVYPMDLIIVKPDENNNNSNSNSINNHKQGGEPIGFIEINGNFHYRSYGPGKKRLRREDIVKETIYRVRFPNALLLRVDVSEGSEEVLRLLTMECIDKIIAAYQNSNNINPSDIGEEEKSS